MMEDIKLRKERVTGNDFYSEN